MFEDLTKKINLQNLTKIKQQHTKPRYSQPQPPQNPDSSSDISDLDNLQLHLQFQQREQNFKNLLQPQPYSHSPSYPQQQLQPQLQFLKKDNTLPPNMIRKYENQIQLLKEKIELERKDQERQLLYQEELYKRREEMLYGEIGKLKFMVKKYQADYQDVKDVRRSLRASQEIKQVLEQRLETIQNQNKTLKLLISQLQSQKPIPTPSPTPTSIPSSIPQQPSPTKLKQLQQDLSYEKHASEQKHKKIQKLTMQLQKSKELLIEKERQYDEDMQRLRDGWVRREEQLVAEIGQLRKRGLVVQENFLEKMAEITKLQAHLLSNNSHTCHSLSAHAIKNAHTRIGQSSLNIAEVSPIKPDPVNSFSDKKPSKAPQTHHHQPVQQQQQNNPQNQKKCKNCQKNLQKYTQKLAKANTKILQLLHSKITHYQQSPQPKPTTTTTINNTNINTADRHIPIHLTHMDTRSSCNRTRIMSWNRTGL